MYFGLQLTLSVSLKIKIVDFQNCIDMFERPMGVLSILEEESLFPKVSPIIMCSMPLSFHRIGEQDDHDDDIDRRQTRHLRRS